MPYAEKKTSGYRIIPTKEGNRYQFFCDLTGMAVCTTEAYPPGGTDELLSAWENGGKKYLNRCCICGRYVADAVYHPAEGACVDCVPWREKPLFCPRCGSPVKEKESRCPVCGEVILSDEED